MSISTYSNKSSPKQKSLKENCNFCGKPSHKQSYCFNFKEKLLDDREKQLADKEKHLEDKVKQLSDKVFKFENEIRKNNNIIQNNLNCWKPKLNSEPNFNLFYKPISSFT